MKISENQILQLMGLAYAFVAATVSMGGDKPEDTMKLLDDIESQQSEELKEID